MNVIVKDNKRKHGRATPRILALEPRVMFDGAAASDAAHAVASTAPAAEAAADAGSHPVEAAKTTDPSSAKAASSNTAASPSSADQSHTPKEADKAAEPASTTAAASAAAPALPSFEAVKEVVIVDGTVADWQTLVSGIDPSIPVIVLHPNAEGRGEVAELTGILSRFHNLDEIHLVTEGNSAGIVILGREGLWDSNLQYAGSCLDAIRGALKEGGELSLYGCSIAATDAGKHFVDDLAADLGNGIKVGASTDKTGPTRLGGDWTLEYTTGVMDTVLPFTLQGMQDFSHCLGCTMVGQFSQPGSTVKSIDGVPIMISQYVGGIANYWYAVVPVHHVNGTTYASGANTGYLNDSGGFALLDQNFRECTDHAPVNDSVPTISGVATAGATLTAGTGTWHDPDGSVAGYTEQWQVSNNSNGTGATNIVGATGTTFTPDSSYINKYISVTVTAADSFGVAASKNSAWVLVANAPAVTSINRTAAYTMTKGGSGLDYTVTFSQTVNNVDASDFTVTGAGVTGTPVITVTAGSAGSSTYTIHVAGLTGDGTVRLDLNASGTGIVGSSTAVGIMSGYTSGQSYTLDNTPPAVTNVTLNSTTYKVGQTLTATITVASDSDGYTLTSGTINGHALSSLNRVNATTYTATYTVTAGDTDVFAGHPSVSIVLADTAGNSNTAYTTAISAATTIDAHAPTDIVPSSTTAILTAGSTVGSLSATDTNSGSETFTYALVVGNGTNDADNSRFVISGNTLNVGASALTAGTYHINLRVTDAGGNTFDKALVITAVNAPAITSIVRTAASSVTTGSSGFDYTVTFNQAVNGVDASDFTVTPGAGVTGTPVIISVTDGSAGSTTYTVHVAGLTGDGTVRLDLKSSGTGITGASSGVGIMSGYTAGQVYTLDNTPPAITAVTLDATTYKVGQTLTATITVASDSDGYTLTSGTINGRALSSLHKVNATTYTATYTVTAGDTDVFAGHPSVSIVFTDTAGNSNTAYTTAISAATTIDAHAPTDIVPSSTTSVLPAGSTVGSLSATDTNSGSETFTYALVQGNGTNDADNSTFVISGNTLSVGASALNVGSYHIYLRVTDAGGNTFDKAFVITAVNAPAVSSINRVVGSSVKTGSSGLDYTVTFSQAVNGVDASDFTVTTGAGVTGTPDITVTAGTDGSSSYTIHVAGLTGDGTVRLDLNSSATGITDASSGVGIMSGYTSGQVYTLDNTPPAITAVTLDATTYKVGQTLTATITVASDSDSYTLTSGTINGRALSSLTKVNATTYTATYTVTAGDADVFSGHPSVSIVFTDTAGNSNTAYTTAISAATTIDAHAPTDISIAGSDTSTHAYVGVSSGTVVGTLSTTDASNGDTFTYTLSGADAGKFEVVGGALRVKSAQTLTAMTDYNVTVQAQDLGGNTYSKAFTITGAAGPAVAVGGTASYTERGAAVALESGLTLTANGSSTMTRATVTISPGTLASGDTLACTVTGTNITASYAGGVLTLTGNDTLAHYQAVLDSVTFVNTVNHDPTASSTTRTITWAVRDQYADGVTATTTLTITPVHDAPTVTTTTGNPTFTEAGSAVSLFSGTSISQVESTPQTIERVVLTVSGLADGANEKLVIDGVAVVLTNGTSGTTASHAIGYAVSISGSTATVTLTKSDTAANWQSYVNGLGYQDVGTGAGITAGNRVVTLSSVKDSGGTANGGSDTASLSAATTVTVTRLNHVPSLAVSTATPTFTEGGTAASLFSGATVSLGVGDSGQAIKTVTFTVSRVTDGNNEIIVVDGQNVVLTAGSTTTAANQFIVTVSGAGSTKTVAITRNGDFTAAQAETLVNGLQYKNLSSDPTVATRVVTLTGIQDSGGGADSTTLTAHSDVALVAVNSAPTLVATGASPSYSVAGSSVALFSGAAISPVEFGQVITELKLTVSGLTDGANEKLVIDGVSVSLDAGTSGTTATNAIGYTVSVSGTVATVTLTKSDTAANWQGYVNGVGYQNTSGALPTGDRVVTLTSLKDSGGTANGGVDTTTLSVSATVKGLGVVVSPPQTVLPVPIPPPPPPTTTTPVQESTPTPQPPASGDIRSEPLHTVVHDPLPVFRTDTSFTPLRDTTQTTPVTPVTPVTVIPSVFTIPTATSFQVAVAAKAVGAPDALVVNSPIRNADFNLGQRISVTIPADSFASTKADSVVTLTATRADGAALPDWIVFNPKTGTFEGNPPPGFKGVVTVKVVARDNDGRQAVQVFRIEVGVAGDGRVQPDGQGERPGGGRSGQTGGTGDRVATDKPAGRPGLLEQLRSMSKEGRLAKQIAVVEGLTRLNKVA